MTVETLGYRGEGIARIERKPVFIKGALPSERVRALVLIVKKDYAVAKLLEVLSPSPHRVTPPCAVFGKCGGCDLMHLDYNGQLAFKRDAVRDALRKIAHIEPYVDECVPSDRVLGCRNKISLPVRKTKDGAAAGLFAYNSHRVVSIDDCPLQTDRVRSVMPALKKFVSFFDPYDEERGEGELRHIVARDLAGALSVTAVVTRDLSERIARAAEEAELAADELWMNVNDLRTNVILGGDTRLLRGERSVRDITIGGITLPVETHPNAFYQVNGSIAAKLYEAVRMTAKNVKPRLIVDAYSGGGLMTALLSDCAERVFGVEIEPSAVAGADMLMQRAGIKNVRNILGDCSAELPRFTHECGDDSLIVLDPPRSGCSEAVTSAVDASGASHVVYVSCDPSTLARDLFRLPSYIVRSVRPFDMFPQTCHVETLICLERK